MIVGRVFRLYNSRMRIEWVGTAVEIYCGFRKEKLDMEDYFEDEASDTQTAPMMKESPDFEAASREYDYVKGLLETVKQDRFEDADRQLKNSAFSSILGQDLEAYPLLFFVMARKTEGVKFFAERRVGLDVTTSLGMTALHWAVGIGNLEAVSVLLNAGADYRILNWCLYSAGELARINEHSSVAEIFLRKTGEVPRIVDPDELLSRTRLLPDLEGVHYLKKIFASLGS